jgi:putative membrane protein
MKTLLFPSAFLVLFLSCSPGADRRGGDTGMAAGAPGGLSSHDTIANALSDSAGTDQNLAVTPQAVLSQIDLANTTEIQLSTVAARKAASPKVKQIAKKLAVDHARNREEERALAQKLNVPLAPPPPVSPRDSVAIARDLVGRAGAEFDRAFVQHEIDDHRVNIEKIQNEMLPGIQDQQIRSYLQKTVIDMQGHLSSLEQLQRQLGS